MVPVDLAHAGRLEKALKTAADLANHYEAEAVYVSVSTAAPSAIAHTPAEFEAKVAAFASDQAVKHGHKTRAHAILSHDPAIDLDPSHMKAADELGADLIVMASHVPGLTDYIWPSNGGQVAGHAKASVFVVRGG
jgi:nucleotide-binding universal stress UspA family protein